MSEVANQTGNPASSLVQFYDAKRYEKPYDEWLFRQLSRMPYLCKGLVRKAICYMLVPDLSRTLDCITIEVHADGWRRGYEACLRDARWASLPPVPPPERSAK